LRGDSEEQQYDHRHPTPKSTLFQEMPAMPYQVNPTEVNNIAAGLAAYYSAAWEAGIKGLFATAAQSQMGVGSKYIDMAKDSYASLKKSSGDSFRVTFRSDLKQQISLFFANKYDVAQNLVTVGEKLIDKVASLIPVPHLGTAVSGLAGVAASKAKDALHDRSIVHADKMLADASDADIQKMFGNDKDTITSIENSMRQYKTLTNYIGTLPTNVTSFDDAITLPKAAFRVQEAASHLNVELVRIRKYCEAMQERLVECQKMSDAYRTTVREKMPSVVSTVLTDAYSEGSNKGKMDVSSNKYTAPQSPKLATAKAGAGGATLLANAMAHALAQGYYDAGNTGPIFATAPKMPPQLRR
jgi:hypothetical protein